MCAEDCLSLRLARSLYVACCCTHLHTDIPMFITLLQVRRNLHVVFSFSPIGDAFRERFSRFPSLVNCTTIDWLTAWPRDALATVAQNFLAGLPGVSDKVRQRRHHTQHAVL